MSILLVVIGIILLIVLIIGLKYNPFVAFIISSIFVGIAEGMKSADVITAIQQGIGDTLGSIVLILGFGAMLGKMVADSGAAQRISSKLIGLFGIRNIQWAMVITGFMVGIPMFYNVGFVVLIPLVFTVAASSGLPLLYVGIPLLASLSVTHGFLPPHPSPIAICSMFDADVGKTIGYGMIISIPAIIVAGPYFAKTLKKVKASPIKEFVSSRVLSEDEMPGIWSSVLTTLMPVILIGLYSFSTIFIPEGNRLRSVLGFLGDPVIAMLISLLAAVYLLGIGKGKKMSEIMESLGNSIGSITMVLLIIAGAGAFKQVLISSGVSNDIAGLLTKSDMSPLLLSWLIAAVIRICIGSATVAGLTTAGILIPLATSGTVDKELMVLAIGAGSLMLSHINDSGFWMYKEYFNLSVKDTFKTWTVMETIVSTIGLFGVLIADMIL
ncbi:MAG: TRAP transporter large permease subunit [Bacteroidales bacterium]|nr:TRAP transporter large permease subunit [Bacteroidales bacterium]